MTKYRKDLEKQEEYGVVAHERLIEPRVTMKWLLAKPRSSLISLLFQILMVSKYEERTGNRSPLHINQYRILQKSKPEIDDSSLEEMV